jgi:hypothetical protein
LTRVFDALHDLTFKAWTEAERVMRWWGPNGVTTPFGSIDLHLGASLTPACDHPTAAPFGPKASIATSSSRSGSSARIFSRVSIAGLT